MSLLVLFRVEVICIFCPFAAVLNIHWLVPTSLLDPAINLYTSVVDLIYFGRLVEPGL